MLKNITIMLTAMLLALSLGISCEKPQPENPQPTIEGNWTDDYGSWMSIIFYQMDGTLVDSVPWELPGTTFSFRPDGTVTAPWGYDYDYLLSNDTLRLVHPGWADRVYRILSFTDQHLVMEYPKTTDYTMGDSTPVIGIEKEHWSLRKMQ